MVVARYATVSPPHSVFVLTDYNDLIFLVGILTKHPNVTVERARLGVLAKKISFHRGKLI